MTDRVAAPIRVSVDHRASEPQGPGAALDQARHIHAHLPMGVDAPARRRNAATRLPTAASPLLMGLQRWEPTRRRLQQRLSAPDNRPSVGDLSLHAIERRLASAWFWERDDRARDLVARMNGADAAALTLRAENALLAELIGFYRTAPDTEAIHRLYATRTLDPAFERALRAQMVALVERIATDRPLMARLRAWSPLGQPARLDALRALSAHIAAHYGIPTPAFHTFEEGEKNDLVRLGYADSKGIHVNVAPGRLDDFETVFDTLVHELGHRHQAHLVEQFDGGRVAVDDPRRVALQALSLNARGYVQPDRHLEAYLNQPMEAHSRVSAAHAVELLRAKLRAR